MDNVNKICYRSMNKINPQYMFQNLNRIGIEVILENNEISREIK